MSKSLFNFYLEDEMEQELDKKLARLLGTQNKGQKAALIRVLIKQFIFTPDKRVNPLLIKAIQEEYVYSTRLKKE